MQKLRIALKSIVSRVGAVLVGIGVLWTVAESLSLFDWVLDLMGNPRAIAVGQFLVTPLGRLIVVSALVLTGMYLIRKGIAVQFPQTNSWMKLVSAGSICGQSEGGVFVPSGNSRCLAVCAMYNPGGTIKNVRAELLVNDARGIKLGSYRDLHWLTHFKPSVTCTSKNFYYVVLGSWSFNETVMIPHCIGRTPIESRLDAGVYHVAVSFFRKNEPIGNCYFRMEVVDNASPEVDRVKLFAKN